MWTHHIITTVYKESFFLLRFSSTSFSPNYLMRFIHPSAINKKKQFKINFSKIIPIVRYNLTLAIIYQTAFSLESHNKPTNACRFYMNDSFKGIISFFFLFMLFIQKPRWPLKFHNKKKILSMFSFSSKLYIYLVITKKLLCRNSARNENIIMFLVRVSWRAWGCNLYHNMYTTAHEYKQAFYLFGDVFLYIFFYVLSQRNICIWPWTLTTRNKIVFFSALKIHQFDALSH